MGCCSGSPIRTYRTSRPNLPFRVELSDRRGQRLRWTVSASSSVAIAHAALDTAIATYPDQRFTLRDGIRVIRQPSATPAERLTQLWKGADNARAPGGARRVLPCSVSNVPSKLRLGRPRLDAGDQPANLNYLCGINGSLPRRLNSIVSPLVGFVERFGALWVQQPLSLSPIGLGGSVPKQPSPAVVNGWPRVAYTPSEVL